MKIIVYLVLRLIIYDSSIDMLWIQSTLARGWR